MSETQIITGPIKTRRWTHPRTEETRYYAASAADALGLTTDFYKSGHLASAQHGDTHLSNSKAKRLLSISVWWEEDGTLHAPEAVEGYPVSEWIREQVAARGLDFRRRLMRESLNPWLLDDFPVSDWLESLRAEAPYDI